MASIPLFIIPDFFFIFQTNFAMVTLVLKEMGKFLWEGREKVCPETSNRADLFLYLPKGIFPFPSNLR